MWVGGGCVGWCVLASEMTIIIQGEVKVSHVCSNVLLSSFPRKYIKKMAIIYWPNLKNPYLKNRWANFSQTWHKAYLADGSYACENKVYPILKKEFIYLSLNEFLIGGVIIVLCKYVNFFGCGPWPSFPPCLADR